MSSLESILNDAVEPEVEAPEVQEAQEIETQTEQPEQQTEETTEETGEKVEESAPDPKEDEEQATVVPIKALMAERDKRQALERQLEEYNSKKEPEKAPDVFDDQEAYTQHLQKEISTQAFNIKAEMSEYLARKEFPTLDKDIEVFQQLTKENPALKQDVYNSPSPYHEIHNIVDKHNRYQDLQNVDKLEAKIRSEIEAKVRAEFEKEAKSKESLRSSIPTSLVGETSTGNAGQIPDKPTSLKSILGD